MQTWKENKIFRWEMTGILLIVGFGTTLHFWFEWTGYWRPIALIAAVNESTWEHFKMAFWPGLFYGLIEYAYLKNDTENFAFAKFMGLLAMPIVTVILFYGYTAVTGHHYLWVDVIIFILSVVGGQIVSYKLLMKTEVFPAYTRAVGLVGLVLMTLVFSALSYYPRHNFLFAHPESGEYGILSDYSHHDHSDEHDGEHDHDDHEHQHDD